MIRQDYFLRLVHEMVQVLARVLSLQQRRQYEQALEEINQALRSLRADTAATAPELTEAGWLDLCRQHEPTATGLTVAVADLIAQQGEILCLQGRAEAGGRARSAALTLFLEALLSGQTFVSADLIDKVERLIAGTAAGPRPGILWSRLVRYFEARCRFGLAEDILFAWAETGDPAARTEGDAFYQRLLKKADDELERGGLPRNEVEEGRRSLAAASA